MKSDGIFNGKIWYRKSSLTSLRKYCHVVVDRRLMYSLNSLVTFVQQRKIIPKISSAYNRVIAACM